MDKKIKIEEIKEPPLFVIDSNVLVKMFEGKDEHKDCEILIKLGEMKQKGIPIKAVTTLSSFMRALWKSDGDAKLKNVHNVLDIIKVLPTPNDDFKNENKVRDDMLKLAHILSGSHKGV